MVKCENCLLANIFDDPIIQPWCECHAQFNPKTFNDARRKVLKERECDDFLEM